jgi:hypothetical protein
MEFSKKIHWRMKEKQKNLVIDNKQTATPAVLRAIDLARMNPNYKVLSNPNEKIESKKNAAKEDSTALRVSLALSSSSFVNFPFANKPYPFQVYLYDSQKNLVQG